MTAVGRTPLSPTEIDTLVALAVREYRAGRLPEASAAFRKLLALRPDDAEVHGKLGAVLKEQGQLAEAAAQYERALALKPDFVEAYNDMGDILREQGKLDQALVQIDRAIALRPDYAEAYNSRGIVLTLQGKLDEAATEFERAVALKPDLFMAQNNLGNILREQGKTEQAVARFKQALVREPESADAHYNLGNALKDLGKTDEAMAEYERAIALKPSLFLAHNNLGCLQREEGWLKQAQASIERALALNPFYPDAFNNLGRVLGDAGKFDEATARYQQAIELKPDNVQAHYNRAQLKTFRTRDADFATLAALVANPDRLPPNKMVYVHFALGKALEDLGDYELAFEQWRQGNALKHREVKYDEQGHKRDCQFVAATFNASLLNRFAGLGDPSQAPIFILGMPRSGSTLIEQILASHPQVQAAGELKQLRYAVRRVTDATGRPILFPNWIQALDADSLQRLGHAYLESLPALADGKTRLTDKMPDNFVFVGLIHLILPNARIIHTVRDPVDTCVSCFSRLFTNLTFTYDLAELGRYYRRYHELMQHWRTALPTGAMLDVSYEDVVNNLEEQARRLISYCGLPWDDRCLRFHETTRPIATASSVQVRRPLYRTSLARWRRYEAYLQPLLAELEATSRSS